MSTIEDHQRAVAAVLGALFPFPQGRATQTLPLSTTAVAEHSGRYRGRVLASDVLAESDVPRFDNSQMDGFAVRTADLLGATPERPVALPARPGGAAGDPALSLPPGTAAEVMTGAPIPPGADAVIPVERTEPGFFGNAETSFSEPVPTGQFVRARGSDVGLGDVLATAGTPLRPQLIGGFTAAGVESIRVHPRVRVAIITTGNEVRSIGDDLGDGHVYDAVGGMLALAIADAGARARVFSVPSDDPVDFGRMVEVAVDISDLVITIGGVSRGAFEVVKLALRPRGVTFTHVAMQPGGPQGLGTLTDDDGRAVPVLCFPGNPVSAMISFEVFLRSRLRELSGLAPLLRRRGTARLAEAWDSPTGMHQIRRGELRADGTLVAVGGPGSHLIAHYGAANVLAHVPIGTARCEIGDDVEVWHLDD